MEGSRKMLRILLTVSLIASAALAQTSGQLQLKTAAVSSATTSKSSTSQKTRTTIDEANKPAITIHGLCKEGTPSKSCNTVLTRRDLQTIMDVMTATGHMALPQQRREIGSAYAELLAWAEAAKKADVEKDPRFANVLRVSRMQALSEMYRVKIDEQARNVSDKEVHAYYTQNPAYFEELTVRRVMIPMYNSKNLKDQDFMAKAKKLAPETRDRAAKGEDLDKLEKEVFQRLAVDAPTTTKMGPVRRGFFAAEQEKEIFGLKPGEVTRVFEQPSLYIFFKLESRRTLTEKDAHNEIVQKLYRERLDRVTKSVTAAMKVDYDDEYVGPAPPKPGAMPVSPLPPAPKEQAASHK
jgi:PPIC-type PPIASE domain